MPPMFFPFLSRAYISLTVNRRIPSFSPATGYACKRMRPARLRRHFDFTQATGLTRLATRDAIRSSHQRLTWASSHATTIGCQNSGMFVISIQVVDPDIAGGLPQVLSVPWQMHSPQSVNWRRGLRVTESAGTGAGGEEEAEGADHVQAGQYEKARL